MTTPTLLIIEYAAFFLALLAQLYTPPKIKPIAWISLWLVVLWANWYHGTYIFAILSSLFIGIIIGSEYSNNARKGKRNNT